MVLSKQLKHKAIEKLSMRLNGAVNVPLPFDDDSDDLLIKCPYVTPKEN